MDMTMTTSEIIKGMTVAEAQEVGNKYSAFLTFRGKLDGFPSHFDAFMAGWVASKNVSDNTG